MHIKSAQGKDSKPNLNNNCCRFKNELKIFSNFYYTSMEDEESRKCYRSSLKQASKITDLISKNITLSMISSHFSKYYYYHNQKEERNSSEKFFP